MKRLPQFGFGLLFAVQVLAQNRIILEPGAAADRVMQAAAHVRPSPEQLAWQRLEMTAFIHFGVNTFTDREWGSGKEDPSRFDPSDLDARQWAEVLKNAGFRLIILTAKHHDGFCLWPSRLTDHSVKNSPWRNGKGDLVQELSLACREAELKFGIYLSPWDRHEPSYGDSEKYNAFFLNQLREILTNYGEIAEVWFDGACGEGANGKRQVYDWPAYYKLIRELQPKAVIAIMGPDVRWVGTESGVGRQTEWSVLPLKESEILSLDPFIFMPRDRMDEDLGSREKLSGASALVWYPSETDVSIRPGWFYHAVEDSRVKSPEQLLDIFYTSVGYNSVLLLNVPPDKRGLIHESDIRSLEAFRKALDNTFSRNLTVEASSPLSELQPLADGNPDTYLSFSVPDSITLEWNEPVRFDLLDIREAVQNGQRIEAFRLDVWDGEWETRARGSTVGARRLVRFAPVAARKIRIVIEEARDNPEISEIGLYRQVPGIWTNPPPGPFLDSLKVTLGTIDPETSIHITTDGTDPSASSLGTNTAFIKKTALIKAVGIRPDGVVGPVLSAEFSKARFPVELEPLPDPRFQKNSLCLSDGKQGTRDAYDGQWLAFRKSVNVRIPVYGPARSLSIGFLRSHDQWIFLPKRIRVFIEDKGQVRRVGGLELREPSAGKTDGREELSIRLKNVRTGTLRIEVEASPCPAWHPGKGQDGWVFVDEIAMER